jgi:O-antigen/teichoic acid export membrane protein
VSAGVNRRRVLVLADQAASSLSNVVVAVLVARSFPDETEPFAAFGLALIVFQFVVGCVRGLLFEPVLASYSDRPAAERMRVVPGYLGATIVVGLALLALLLAVALAVGGMAGSALSALAVVLPFVLVQDAWRYMFMIDRAGAALAIDLVWLAVSCAAILLAPDDAAVAWYVLAWGAGGAIGALVATGIGRRSLGRLRAWSYVRDHGDLAWRFFSEYLTAQAGNYAALFACGSLLGLTAYGAVRAGSLFLGPLLTLQAAVILAALPEATRLRDEPGRLRRLIVGAAAMVAIPALAWTAVGMLAPASFGRELFGPTWTETRRVLVPMGLAQVGLALIAAGLVGVRALDPTKGLGARLRSVPFQFVCPLVGAMVGDLVGFGVGMAIGQAVAATVWWRTFLRLLHLRPSARPAPFPSDTAVDTVTAELVTLDEV